uniref:Uncharacterized protein n=1 Tax=Nelumbo nucifera TaxID=4432 RepID=A0A822ZJI9_NELNU|nr:TPA_asm: hypothetical protein HUJ06_001386 [Nelumbo nucifera]
MIVADLMFPNPKRWDERKIRLIFSQTDAKAILAIPLGQSSTEDKLMWGFSKSRESSVKSFYHLAQGINSGNHPPIFTDGFIDS